jgi:hypothetical protein
MIWIFKLLKYLKRKKQKENEIQKIILGNKIVEYDSNLLRDEEEIKTKLK